MLTPFLFVVDVATEYAREGVLSELSYADDLLSVSETIMGLPNRCRPLRGWKTHPEKERRGRPNRHHSIPAPREGGLIQPFFR